MVIGGNFMTTIIKNKNYDLFFKCAQIYRDQEWLNSLNWRQRNKARVIFFENDDYQTFKRRINQLK